MQRFLWVVLLFSVCLIQSCKEGCKDKTAINYDKSATVENGTCLYCTSSFVSDTATYFFTAPNAPNPSVNSIEFILVSTNSSINGNGCQTQGKQTGSNCKNYLRMVNLTSVNVDGEFNVEFTQSGNLVWFFEENNFIDMSPPGMGSDTLNLGLIDSAGCSNLATGVMSPNLSSLQFF